MPRSLLATGDRYPVDRYLLLGMLALLLLITPANRLWASVDGPWYGPILMWGLLILLSYRLNRAGNRG